MRQVVPEAAIEPPIGSLPDTISQRRQPRGTQQALGAHERPQCRAGILHPAVESIGDIAHHGRVFGCQQRGRLNKQLTGDVAVHRPLRGDVGEQRRVEPDALVGGDEMVVGDDVGQQVRRKTQCQGALLVAAGMVQQARRRCPFVRVGERRNAPTGHQH